MRRHLLVSLAIFAAAGPIAGPGLFGRDKPNPAKQLEPPLTARDREHWAFLPPQHQAVPRVSAAEWIRTPVDAFILARLEQAGLKPSPPADRATLIRRLALDLTGLPPSPGDVARFLHDTSPEAYAKAVERLLASPHYGERWAQHWLDVARYAESNGYEADGERIHAWRYRDYVVRSLNEDKPFDVFLTEQLAGDKLARNTKRRPNSDLLVATGFNRCGPIHLVGGNTDPEVNRQEVLTEMTNGVAAAFFGLTLGCARCHDHKFDPISQADYYRLQSFFAATQAKEFDIATEAERAAYARRLAEVEAQIAPLTKSINELEAPYRARLEAAKKAHLEPRYRAALAVEAKKRTPEQKKLAADAEVLLKVTWDEIVGSLTAADRARRAAWRAQIHALEAQKPLPPAQAWGIEDEPETPRTHVLVRGNPHRKGPEVEPAFPRVLVKDTSGPGPLDRLALARWLTRPDHALTARVLVNRLWQHHFGRGLVATPNDFGLRGEPPTHPELLDWLACEFTRHGWSIKHMHRLMMLSSTYQQSSRASGQQAAKKIDPENRLLWHMNRQRLEGEGLRDSVLAVTGALNESIGGPMVRVPLEPAVYELIFTEGEPDGLWLVTPDARQHQRRSLYLFAKRNVRLPMLEAFDQPDTLNSCPVRPVSTYAPQALILLNGPFMQEQSRRFAGRLLRESPGDPARQIECAYQLALARPPRSSERDQARAFLAAQRERILERLQSRQAINTFLAQGTDPATAAALADFCLALLNRNEFLYVN
jgi:Protein of unknown function (DUF1553)/Protein of unknown function (DUF1549)